MNHPIARILAGELSSGMVINPPVPEARAACLRSVALPYPV
jgi:hypothetical protein